MCKMVYIASDQPLPRSPQGEKTPGFYIVDAPEKPGLREQFSLPHLCYAGSHTGCGCGFQVGEYAGSGVEEDHQDRAESRSALAAFLREQLTAGRTLELFACWDGDEEKKPVRSGQIAPEQLVTEFTFFEDGDFFRLVPDTHAKT
jgi:hypothetical protein